MTVQAGIEVDVDIATLVGELDELGCESSGHDSEHDVHGAGPATHYVRVTCSHMTTVKAYCQGFVDSLTEGIIVSFPCGEDLPSTFCTKILAPVKP